MKNKIKTYIVSPDYNLKKKLGSIKELEIIGISNNGEDFLNDVFELNPEIIFMDANMPLMNGVVITKKAILLNENLNIIAMVNGYKNNLLFHMVNAGAKGFILKNSCHELIIKTIDDVLKDNIFHGAKVFENVDPHIYY